MNSIILLERRPKLIEWIPKWSKNGNQKFEKKKKKSSHTTVVRNIFLRSLLNFFSYFNRRRLSIITHRDRFHMIFVIM